MTKPHIRRGYSDSSFGQIHWHMAEMQMAETQIAGDQTAEPDLYCLHPAPYSGLAYSNIMPHLAQGRRVIAPDYPGAGGSDPFRSDASVAHYADAMAQLIANLSDGQPVDFIGFHTGCLVAAEIAIATPQLARRLVLIDVPAFDADTRAKQMASSGAEFEITPDITCLENAWHLGMTKRIESQGLDRSFAMFVEQLRHGRGRNAAFHAGFAYDVEGRLPQISTPTSIIASQSMLLDATRRAAGLIPQSTLIERLDITRAVLDEAAPQTAQAILEIIS